MKLKIVYIEENKVLIIETKWFGFRIDKTFDFLTPSGNNINTPIETVEEIWLDDVQYYPKQRVYNQRNHEEDARVLALMATRLKGENEQLEELVKTLKEEIRQWKENSHR